MIFIVPVSLHSFEMVNRKTVRRIDYLNILLCISGIQPVYDQRKNGSKYSKIGILCIILHTYMCIYSDHKLEEEQRVIRMFLRNIMFAMTYLQRFANLCYPMVCVLGAILQFESLAKFLELEEHLDLYLKSRKQDVTGMHKKIRRMQLVSVIISLFVGVISCASYCSYTAVLNTVQFYTYYTGLFFSMNFALVIFKIFNHYYALHLRADLYTQHLKKILECEIGLMNLRLRY